MLVTTRCQAHNYVALGDEDFYERLICEVSSSQATDPAGALAAYRAELGDWVPVEELAEVEARAWAVFRAVKPVLPEGNVDALLAWYWTALTTRLITWKTE